ncbi:putative mediator of RNA polymerase II transcription subunit [Lasiosphaeria hispida]|uniref:Mediator of RNA polymerase II transcription subunit 10 n=1 Tax=Lasiosphaeria hispida TaxID=260671 RepID=A0AAJ0HMR9_9PEZI|nr:putative mediator of RNA polymerase II transcription subunit [Lasiosphaeria hispida]
MAPVNTDQQAVQENVKNVIQDLFQVLAQVSNYDAAGRPSREALAHDLQTLDASLLAVHHSATAAAPTSPGIPETLIHYVENGRNPDIYTREFVELVRRLNQLMRGKMHAFGSFRDVLAHEMEAALPELRDDVRRVVENTGGRAAPKVEASMQQQR